MKHVITTLTLVLAMSLAMTAPASQSRKHAPKGRANKAAKIYVCAADVAPMVGTWTLRNGEKPRTDIRMVFRNNGTFAFVGPNWQSAGKFRMASHVLSLEWTSVDGSKVAPGTMKKDFPMAEDDSSFRIDTYTYYKLR